MGATEEIAVFRKETSRMAFHLLLERIAFHREDTSVYMKSEAVTFLSILQCKSTEITFISNQENLPSPPLQRQEGKITAEIQRAFLKPLSLIIIKNWAMQGMKRVMVTKLTRI